MSVWVGKNRSVGVVVLSCLMRDMIGHFNIG